MLTEKQLEELKEHLEKAQRPVFYYDNDLDGLCSFLLLRRYIGRGEGIVVKSYPDLGVSYAKKAQDLRADYIFVLDKPLISKEFLETLDSFHIPVVWLDHHAVVEEINNKKYSNLYFYNPAFNKGKDRSNEPVTYLCYKITKRREDLWIAVMGCIADHYLPDFAKEFLHIYPDYWGNVKMPFDAYYKTEIGRIAQALSFGLKDSISHVKELETFIFTCKGPDEIFLELETNKSFRARYSEIKRKYNYLVEKAKDSISEKMIFFSYSGDLSISAEISNELSYIYPEKYIIVAYIKGSIVNISLRGKRVREILGRILSSFDDASGGGHDDAVGARIKAKDLKRFEEFLTKEIGND